MATTGPVSSTGPASRKGGLVLRWVHPRALLPPCPLSAPLVSIGRASDNHVAIDQRSLSRHHARVERRGRACAILDQSSRNGVFVDGERVQRAPLVAGSVVRLGDLVGVVHEQADGLSQEPVELSAGLVGSATLAAPLALALRVARTPLSLLIAGETGSGKELVARAVHEASGRDGSFVAVNCAALTDSLLDAELFGHERGAFTGADRARPGWIRSAERGTLFLDEVAELGASAQAKLLRALEERAVTPVGSSAAIPVDFRVIAATHRSLPELSASGRFRVDLYARLEGAQIRLPALRERREDVADLFHRFAGAALGRPCPRLSARLVERLLLHAWPRNVRELRQTAERFAALHAAEPEWRSRHFSPADPAPLSGDDGAAQTARGELDVALTASGGNVAAAARKLGVSKQTLYRWINQSGIDLARFRRETEIGE